MLHQAVGETYPVSRPVALRSMAVCPAQKEYRDYQKNKFEELSFGASFLEKRMNVKEINESLRSENLVKAYWLRISINSPIDKLFLSFIYYLKYITLLTYPILFTMKVRCWYLSRHADFLANEILDFCPIFGHAYNHPLNRVKYLCIYE
jgi:hypothetical protein